VTSTQHAIEEMTEMELVTFNNARSAPSKQREGAIR
jgi:hypothetical protein